MKEDQLKTKERLLSRATLATIKEVRKVYGQYMEQKVGYLQRQSVTGPVLLSIYKIFRIVTIQTRKVARVNGGEVFSDWQDALTMTEFIETQVRVG